MAIEMWKEEYFSARRNVNIHRLNCSLRGDKLTNMW